jgi:hypothetical protein
MYRFFQNASVLVQEFCTAIFNLLLLHVTAFSIEDGHVIPGLIHKTYLAKKNGKKR